MKHPLFCLGLPLLLMAIIPQPAQAERAASELLPADTLSFRLDRRRERIGSPAEGDCRGPVAAG